MALDWFAVPIARRWRRVARVATLAAAGSAAWMTLPARGAEPPIRFVAPGEHRTQIVLAAAVVEAPAAPVSNAGKPWRAELQQPLFITPATRLSNPLGQPRVRPAAAAPPATTDAAKAPAEEPFTFIAPAAAVAPGASPSLVNPIDAAPAALLAEYDGRVWPAIEDGSPLELAIPGAPEFNFDDLAQAATPPAPAAPPSVPARRPAAPPASPLDPLNFNARTFRPITQVTIDAALPEGLAPGRPGSETKSPASAPLPTVDDPRFYSTWPVANFQWAATSFCHRPLYFEEVNLERYGYTVSPVLQPFISGAHFFATIPALPYKMTRHCPRECVYTLGHYRPGDCVPRRWHHELWDPTAAAVEAGVVTGLIFLIP